MINFMGIQERSQRPFGKTQMAEGSSELNIKEQRSRQSNAPRGAHALVWNCGYVGYLARGYLVADEIKVSNELTCDAEVILDSPGGPDEITRAEAARRVRDVLRL